MKTFLMLFVICSIAQLQADEKFLGTARWTKKTQSGVKVSFSELEKNGVKFSAMEAAMDLCREKGYRDCVYVSSKIVFPPIMLEDCGAQYFQTNCNAESVVFGLE